MTRTQYLTEKSLILTVSLMLAVALIGGCRKSQPAPLPEPEPAPVVVTGPYSVDLAFTRYRQAWALVALHAAEQADKGISEDDVNAWAKPRKEAALKESFGILADEMDARLDNPATPEQYAAAMREMAYLADPSLKAE